MLKHTIATVALIAAPNVVFAQDDYGLSNPYAVKVAIALSGFQSKITSIGTTKSEKGVKVMFGNLRMQVHSEAPCEIVWVVTNAELPGEHHTALHLDKITSYQGKGRFRNNIPSARGKPVYCETTFGMPDNKNKPGGMTYKCRKEVEFASKAPHMRQEGLDNLASAVEWCNRGE